MKRFNASAVLFALVISAVGCSAIDLSDPAQVKSDAELTGNLVAFTFLIADPAAASNAAKYLVVVKALRKYAGTTSISDARDVAVRAYIADNLTGDDARFVPTALILSKLLLAELDQKVGKVKLYGSAEAALFVADAFLKGVEDALTLPTSNP